MCISATGIFESCSGHVDRIGEVGILVDLVWKRMCIEIREEVVQRGRWCGETIVAATMGGRAFGGFAKQSRTSQAYRKQRERVRTYLGCFVAS